jgi:hypothetical protein
MRSKVRRAAVAGTFYPNDPTELEHLVDRELAAAAADETPPKALIVPHAGYAYSGAVAASGYVRLRSISSVVRTVVLLGPAHREPVRSMAVPSVDAFATPLGPVAIDSQARDLALTLDTVDVDDRAHRSEHSLEVHLPFLQRSLGSDFAVLPIVVGAATPAAVAELLELLWGGAETVIVVSTDLSHYHDYETAQVRDRATAAAIVDRRHEAVGPRDACGAYPLSGLLETARRRDLNVRLVDLRNSGDTAGPDDRVVGYGTFVIEEP